MIKAHEYLDLDNSVINVSGMIIKELIVAQRLTYDELHTRIYKINGERMKYVFLYAIDLLYLLGRLTYHKETDSMELIV